MRVVGFFDPGHKLLARKNVLPPAFIQSPAVDRLVGVTQYGETAVQGTVPALIGRHKLLKEHLNELCPQAGEILTLVNYNMPDFGEPESPVSKELFSCGFTQFPDEKGDILFVSDFEEARRFLSHEAKHTEGPGIEGAHREIP